MSWSEFIKIPYITLFELGEIAIERDNEERDFTAQIHGMELKKSYNAERKATRAEIDKAISIGLKNALQR